jgi:hypothetical protein
MVAVAPQGVIVGCAHTGQCASLTATREDPTPTTRLANVPSHRCVQFPASGGIATAIAPPSGASDFAVSAATQRPLWQIEYAGGGVLLAVQIRSD